MNLYFICRPFFFFALFFTLFTISAVEATSHFSGNLNRPPKFRTAQGSDPMSGRLPPSSAFSVITFSLPTVVGVLLVVACSPAPHVGQDRGASG